MNISSANVVKHGAAGVLHFVEVQSLRYPLGIFSLIVSLILQCFVVRHTSGFNRMKFKTLLKKNRFIISPSIYRAWGQAEGKFCLNGKSSPELSHHSS